MSVVRRARSLLFVPGDRPERFARAAASGADLVVLDLEDAVAPARKDQARAHVLDWLAGGAGDVAVRVNGPGTPWHAADVAAVAGRDAPIVLPKAESAAGIAALTGDLGSARVIALVETAVGLRDVDAVCSAPGVVRAALGTVDLGAELGVDPASSRALLLARSRLVLASAAAGLPAPVDGVTVDLQDDETLARDLALSQELGFGAKLCIHPRQVAAVNERFTPDDGLVAWAERVLVAAAGQGVVVVDGAMVDAPVVRRAERVLERRGDLDNQA